MQGMLHPLTPDDLRALEIVVPGALTTSFLALRLVLDAFEHRELPFDEIPEEVASGRAEAASAASPAFASIRS